MGHDKGYHTITVSFKLCLREQTESSFRLSSRDLDNTFIGRTLSKYLWKGWYTM